MTSRFAFLAGSLLVLLPASCGRSVERAADDAAGAPGHDGSAGEPAPPGAGGSAGKPAPPGAGGSAGKPAPPGEGGSAGEVEPPGEGGSAGIEDPGAGGRAASAGAGGTSGGHAGGGYLLMPDSSGWIDRSSNTIGVQGAWYVYGDQYGVPGRCISVGLHSPAECSQITSPTPPPFGTPLPQWTGVFDNVAGEMCTTGATAIIQACQPGVTTEGCPSNDFANMWGAGIGFDLNADKGEEGGQRHVWPMAPGIIGFSFSIDEVPATTTLRVEVLVLLTDAEAAAVGLPSGSTSEDHPKESPYWITAGTPSTYPPSNVQPGGNRVLWSEIRHPTDAIDVTTITQRMLGIRFRAPAMPKGSAAKGAFGYCVKDFTFITQ